VNILFNIKNNPNDDCIKKNVYIIDFKVPIKSIFGIERLNLVLNEINKLSIINQLIKNYTIISSRFNY